MRRHADSGLLAGSTRPIGAHVPHAPRSAAERTGPGRPYGDGGRQSITGRAVSPGLQSAMCGPGRGARHRLRPVDRHAPRRSLLCPGRTGVAKDNTVHDHRHRLQIPQDKHQFHSVHATVRVHEYPARNLGGVSWATGVARYQADGQLLDPAYRRTGPTQGPDTRPIVDHRPTVKAEHCAHR